MYLKSKNRVDFFLIISIIILFLHITRNISLMGYVSILFISYIFLFASLYLDSINKKNKMIKFNSLLDFLFLLTYLWIPFFSLFYLELNEFMVSFSRFLITFPLLFFLIIYDEYSVHLTEKVFKVLSFLLFLSSLSIFYQIIFGEISFFAEPSFRAGLVRYASLTGSLTSFGTLGALGLAILLFDKKNIIKNIFIRNFMIFILILGMLATLQKSALINIVLLLLIYIFLNTKKIFKSLFLIVLLFFILFLIYNFLPQNLQLYIDNSINYTISGSNFSLREDLIYRLAEQPFNVKEFHDINSLDYLFGIGFPALAGSLGVEGVPMSHNNYFDLIYSGGIFHFLFFIILLFRVPILILMKNKKTYFDKTYFALSILIIVNMGAGQGTLYQPINAIFNYYLLFSFDYIIKRREFYETNYNSSDTNKEQTRATKKSNQKLFK